MVKIEASGEQRKAATVTETGNRTRTEDTAAEEIVPSTMGFNRIAPECGLSSRNQLSLGVMHKNILTIGGEKVSTQLKICLCPFEPNIGIAGDLVISVSPPYSESNVTVTINPNVTEYIEGKTEGDVQIAQLMVHHGSDETITTKLDVQNNPKQVFAYGGNIYSIKFMGTSKELREGHEFLSFEFLIDVLELTDIQKEGSMTFILSHEHSEWMSNKNGYRFAPLSKEGLFIQPFKEPDGTFRISINGPLGHSLTLRQDISGISTPKLHVALTWKDLSLKLYLNGEFSKEKRVEENLA